jgi:hypothetical protein
LLGPGAIHVADARRPGRYRGDHGGAGLEADALGPAQPLGTTVAIHVKPDG